MSLFLAVLAPSDSVASIASFTFTAPNPGWVPVTVDGVAMSDVEGDTPTARDIVGDAANPLLFVAATPTHIYFRLRIDEDPRQTATNFAPFGWGCFINTDTDLTTYEYSTIIDGVNNPDRISFFKNSATTLPNSPNDDPDLPAVSSVSDPLLVTVGHAQVTAAGSSFGGTPDFFLDWAVDRAAAESAGFIPGITANYYCGSSNSGTKVDADCSGSTAGGCPLDGQFSDPITCSANGCGVCGDGVIGGDEGCDDGNLVSGDGCNDICLIENGDPCVDDTECASTFCDPTDDTCACDDDTDCGPGELCDGGVNPNQCVPSGCSNGIIEVGEGCDDGNLVNGDGCNDACLIELGLPCTVGPACASAFCDPANNTCACDDDLDCPSTDLCDTSTDPNICVAPGCGNNILEAGEGCDDGNLTTGDGCGATCLLELGEPCLASATCESAFCDPADDTCACDDDADCSGSDLCDTSNDPNICVAPGCGNNILELGEGCDDGNVATGDGCGATCLLELGEACLASAACESAFCDPADSTCACDDDSDCGGSDLCNTLALPNECVAPGCGNFVVEPTEACDDGNLTDGDGCNGVCLREIGEDCQQSNQCASAFCDVADDTCACDDDADCATGEECNVALAPNECVPSGCGNGVQSGAEGCDDGNLTNGDGCNAQCLLELGESCGDSAVCASSFCDPAGNICACDQDADCPNPQLCDTSFDPNQCVPSICGDGSIDGAEGCDDQNTTAGDGCSDTCEVEDDWVCNQEPSICEPAPCTSDADCTFCNEQYSICVQGCVAAGDCPNGFFCDEQSMICVPLCTMGAECPSGVCDAGTGECVECLATSDCGTGEICSDNVCGPGCVADADCEPYRICDTAAAICVECLSDLDCGGQLSCIDSYCLPGCNEEVDCGANICNETIGVCIECENDTECPTGEVCDEPTGQCVPDGCSHDSQCPGEVCDEPTHECVECTEDSECGQGLVCDEGIHECVECTEDSECGEGLVCDEGIHECVECTEDSECGEGLVCDEGVHECVECTEDSECGEDLVCDEGVHECVGCTEDSDCGEDLVCDEGVHECVGCVEDSDCGEGLVCEEGIHQCVGCTEDADCPQGVCNDDGTCGCQSDADCPAGQTCDSATGLCSAPAGGMAVQGGACGCEVPGRPARAPSSLLFALLGACGLALRRRRQR